MITAKLLLVYILQSADINGLSVDTTNINQQEAYCLAQNVYYEARSEDIKGQFAVASVTLNRMKDSRFPNTVCDVVQFSIKSKITNTIVCAFSWYCENNRKGREIPVRNKDGSENQAVIEQFRTASIVAISVLAGGIPDNTFGATHFHNPFVSNPAWKKEMKKTIRVGNHDFYR